jgi:hypothetical protein
MESSERQTSWKTFSKVLCKGEGLCKRLDAIDFVLLEELKDSGVEFLPNYIVR